MKNSTKMFAITGIISALAMTSVAGTAFTAFAQEEGDQAYDPQVKEECNRRPGGENMEAMKEAIESGDYDAWVALVSENKRGGEILEKINADNFYLLSEMHQAKVDGDHEKVKEIAEELDIKPRFKGKKGMKKGMGMDPEVREQLKEAVQTGDFDTFSSLVSEGKHGAKILENVNADNFFLLNEMHEARANGDFESAKEIAEQLGLPERPQRMNKFRGEPKQ